MAPRTLSLLLWLTGLAYFVDLFLRWAPRHDEGEVPFARLSGWELAPWSALPIVALLLLELVRLLGTWPAPASSLLGFFLAAGTGIFALSGLLHLRWGFYSTEFGNWAYGAWIALALAAVLVLLASLRLVEHRRSFGVRSFG